MYGVEEKQKITKEEGNKEEDRQEVEVKQCDCCKFKTDETVNEVCRLKSEAQIMQEVVF